MRELERKWRRRAVEQRRASESTIGWGEHWSAKDHEASMCRGMRGAEEEVPVHLDMLGVMSGALPEQQT